MPMTFSYYKSRYNEYSQNSFKECGGQSSLCENDCKMCQPSRTGYNCAGICNSCLLGGSSIADPTIDGTVLCDCGESGGNPKAGCCPQGFALIVDSTVLEIPNQISGIKAGLVTFYERNRGRTSDSADSYFKGVMHPYSDEKYFLLKGEDFTEKMKYGFAEHSPAAAASASKPYYKTGWKYLKKTQLQAGCYPCPGMFNHWDICDNSDGSNYEDIQSIKSEEYMWQLKTQLNRENSLDYNLWKLATPPYADAPQKFPFPYGYQEDSTGYAKFNFLAGYSLTGVRISGLYGVGSTSSGVGALSSEGATSAGYADFSEAKDMCNRNSECKYLVNIRPPPATANGEKIEWLEGDATGKSVVKVDLEYKDYVENEIGMLTFPASIKVAKNWCYNLQNH